MCLVSIQATPITRLVWTASGRSEVSYTAGSPPTGRPAGCQTPSPGRRSPAGEVIRRGTGRCAGPNLVRAFLADPPRSGIDPLAGAPPTGGWWWEYQTFSTQFTMGLPPCMRNHSAARAPGEEPRPGLVSAFPSDTQTGVSPGTTAQTPHRTGWRPPPVR